MKRSKIFNLAVVIFFVVAAMLAVTQKSINLPTNSGLDADSMVIQMAPMNENSPDREAIKEQGNSSESTRTSTARNAVNIFAFVITKVMKAELF